MKDELWAAIEDKTANVVVLGLGYVGLPVACLFAEAGFPVVGIRRSQDKVEMINRGVCPIEGREPGLAELLTRVVTEGRLRATTDYEVCREAQIVLIAVETPVDPVTKKPGYQALRGALTDLAQNLSRGTMVIIESTIAPGTMATVVKPLLEETSGLRVNEDFYLVDCPERVMPGKLLANIVGCHRVVGGMSPEAAELAVEFYRYVVQADLDAVDCLTAELVKTMENAYRDVQIAFANEMALLCEDMGADVWQIRGLVNKSPYRAMHLPGAGVGGHCIPKDPWLLIANASDGFEPRLIPAARAINDGMPLHTANLTVKALRDTGVAIESAKVAVLGYAYLENSDDTRNSPSEVLVARLRELGAEVVIHDPFVPGYQGDLREMVRDCDAVVLMVAHDAYRAVDLSEMQTRVARPILIDGRHVFDAEQARAAGWDYRGVGCGLCVESVIEPGANKPRSTGRSDELDWCDRRWAMTVLLAEEVKQLVLEELPAWIEEQPDLRRRLQRAIGKIPGQPSSKMTYEEFLDWADEDTLAEWVDGEVVMYSPASRRHQNVGGFLYEVLRAYVRPRHLGEVIQAPFQIKLERGREPDLLFVASEHLDRLKETYLDGPADLVVEIVSPGPDSVDRDRGSKFYEYARGGVPEYWLIDPQERWAEFYRLEARHYRPAFSGEEGVYRSEALPGFWLRVEWLWQKPLPHPLRALGEIAGVDTELVERFLQALGGE